MGQPSKLGQDFVNSRKGPKVKTLQKGSRDRADSLSPQSMTSQARRGGVSLPDRRSSKKEESSIITRMSQSQIVSRGKQAASDAAFVAKKLLKSTGKAAWIAGTTFLVLVVPLIIEMDREQQMNDLELQQASLLGTPAQK